jgi:hypothetical protein
MGLSMLTTAIAGHGSISPVDSVGPPEIGRILAVTDARGMSREGVVIPLGTVEGGRVRFNARKKVEITAPSAGFDEWLKVLPELLRRLDQPV